MSDAFAPPPGLTGPPPLSILMVASEAFPHAKTGGLADVVGALPDALRRLGHRVTVVVPRYREVGPLGAAQRRLDIVMGGRRFEVGLIEDATADGGRTVFVECAELYDRIGLYGRDGVDHPDNAVRFGVLCRAALDEAAHWDTPPAVVHAHDWQTGLVPVLLRSRHATDPRWRTVPSVFTIHNLAYQGLFPPETLQALDLDRSLFTIDGLEFWNQVGLLKAGIAFRGRDYGRQPHLRTTTALRRTWGRARRTAAASAAPAGRHRQRHRRGRLGPAHGPLAAGAVFR